MDGYRDRVALVTGAASGLGRGLALGLAAYGAKVVAADIDAAGLATLAADGVEAVALDVRDAAAFRHEAERAAARHGRIDYLFNVAGIAVAGEIHGLAPEAWRRIVDVNLMGTVHGVHAVYPLMMRAGAGHIVNMASIAGLVPFPLLAPYSATKFAVVGFTECLRHEAEMHGVGVTLVCPGFVDTGIYRRAEVQPGFDADSAELLPFPRLETGKAVATILRGVSRRRERIVFPAYWRWCWLLYRLHPALLSPGTRRLLAAARAAVAKAGA